jgi:RNA polymerase sigma factor (sigma-70 family)
MGAAVHCDAQDIVQEACLRAFRGIAGFGGRNARGWVLTIVRHTAYDWIRKRRGREERVEDVESLGELLEWHDGAATPESMLVCDQDTEQVGRAIGSLPASYRDTLHLRYEQGLTYGEIAKVTGVRPGTVMSRLHRARRQLGATLATKAA